MSNQSSTEPQKSRYRFSRRRFVQSTALLTGLSVGGRVAVEPSPIQAQEIVADAKLAQALPAQVAPAPIAPPAQTQPAARVTPPISDEEFIRLSRVLTGIDKLEPDLAHEYLLRCTANAQISGQLKTLAQTVSSLKGSDADLEKRFHDKLKDEPADSQFFAASEQIIYLWYIGAFFKPNPSGGGSWDYGLPQHYFRGKVWSVIGTAPPMTGHTLPKGQRSFDFWAKRGTIGA